MKKRKKTVWITGATSGIGLAFAGAYAKKGYRLILTARRKERLEKIKNQLGTDCRIVPADLSVAQECLQLCEILKQEKIDIFINNAGFGTCGEFTQTSLSKELDMIRVNVEAMHILCKQVLCQMEERGSGTIVNVASSAGLLPGGPYMTAYYATKSYVVSLTKGIAEELRRKKSRVYICALCPGPVDTAFNSRADVEFALPGISTKQCVKEALRGMRFHRVIIVPGFSIRIGCALQRLVPDRWLLPLVAGKQKEKFTSK